jgi:glucokinase
MEYILVTDIGGTHARFFLFELNKSDLTSQKILKEKHYRTTEYKSIDEILDLYLQEYECQNHKPTYCSIAIAGNVIQNKIDQFANFEWSEIDGDKIAAKYGF